MASPERVRLPAPGQGATGDGDAGALGGLPPISELDAQRYDVQAGAELADTYDQVLKHGESFAVFDRHGDILPEGMGEEGLYHRGTRHLSGLVLRLASIFDRDLRFVTPSLGRKHDYTSAKARNLLGWKPRPTKDTVLDTAHSLLANGIA